MAEHPRIQAAEAELAAARLEGQAARRFLASPTISVGWQRQESATGSIDGPLLGIAWSVPLLNRNRGQRAAAEARVAGAQARVALAQREVNAARVAAQASFERLSLALGEAGSALVASERFLDAAEAAFRLGETSLSELLDTHRAVTDAALAALDLREAALASHRELERLAAPAGQPEPRQPNHALDRKTHP